MIALRYYLLNQMNMNEKWIFDSFAEWCNYLGKACLVFLKGIFKLVYSFLGGVASFVWWLYRVIAAFCRRELVASMIVGLMLVILSFGWVSTYMNGKVAVRTAEFQRDSLGYRLDKMMQAYEGASLVVVDNDTLYNGQ